MREGERGGGGGGSVSWTHFKVIVLDMSFTEHPSNHINKGLDALGGWKEIWISLWCIILTLVLTWVLGTEDSCAQKEDLGPFCNKHSGMDLLRRIPSYSEINLRTHTHTQKQMAESWKWWMQWTNYNCCTPDQRKCVSVCECVCALGLILLIAGFYLNFTKTWQKFWTRTAGYTREGV